VRDVEAMLDVMHDGADLLALADALFGVRQRKLW